MEEEQKIEKYTIDEFSEKLSVSTPTLRRWEKELNLIVKRDERGNRFYSNEDLSIFALISKLREEKVPLPAIEKELMKKGIIQEHSLTVLEDIPLNQLSKVEFLVQLLEQEREKDKKMLEETLKQEREKNEKIMQEILKQEREKDQQRLEERFEEYIAKINEKQSIESQKLIETIEKDEQKLEGKLEEYITKINEKQSIENEKLIQAIEKMRAEKVEEKPKGFFQRLFFKSDNQ